MKFTLLLVFLCFHLIYAWNNLPHMICIFSFLLQKAFAIAKKYFKSETLTKIMNYLSYTPQNDLNYDNLYELACWSEDIHSAALQLYDDWHFAYQQFYDNIKPEESTLLPKPQNNITYVLNETINFFNKNDTNRTFDKAIMLRFYFHLIGDLHQPLHVMTRITANRKNGDQGGMLFKLKGEYDNLHTLWDSMMGKLPKIRRVFFLIYVKYKSHWKRKE